MTGGWLMLRAEAEDVLHRDFVTLAELAPTKRAGCGALSRKHLLHGKPRALACSHAGGIAVDARPAGSFSGTVEATWNPILANSNSVTRFCRSGDRGDLTSCASRLSFIVGRACPARALARERKDINSASARRIRYNSRRAL